MISAQNLRLLLNGSRFFVFVGLFFLAACSKKTVPVKTIPEKVKPAEPESVPAKESVHSIALLLPFYLNQIQPETANNKEISRADLGIDYYQGFKLALDSLAAQGFNFRLHVFDSQEQEVRVANLARANSVLSNDLIVGPVFPESIKVFAELASVGKKLQVSPLAAAMPSQFKNPQLVTVNNSIDQHAWKIADFISRNYQPEKINLVLINTKRSDEEKFVVPFRKYLKALSNNSISLNERSNAIDLEEQLSASKINLVIIASDQRSFLLPVIDRLYKLSQENYKIEVFGHPNWIKAQFLDVAKMQALNTHITSSYFIDYKAANVKHFVSQYRREYGLEPSEFAFKGFDAGYYFGKLLARYGMAYANHLTDETYEGLHHSFRFIRDEKTGYLNAEVMMLQYREFELQLIK